METVLKIEWPRDRSTKNHNWFVSACGMHFVGAILFKDSLTHPTRIHFAVTHSAACAADISSCQ